MNKVFVVIEEWTNAFCGLFSTAEKAWEEANEIGGTVIEYIFDGKEWRQR